MICPLQIVKEPPKPSKYRFKYFDSDRRGRVSRPVCNFLNRLATQYILTYCTNRTLTYHLYADECDLFVFGASLPSVSLS